MTTPTLRDEIEMVARNLKSRPWMQGDFTGPDGAVCAHGAVRTCQGLRPGDEHIIRAVMRTKGLTEGWNDEEGRTKDEVVARLEMIEVSDADLAETFGPSWRLVIAVIRRSALPTTGEAIRQAVVWALARDAAWDAARGAAWDAAWDAAGGAAWDAAGGAGDAACAASVADLVGKHGLTHQHIDTLMHPWITVLGDDWAEGMMW